MKLEKISSELRSVDFPITGGMWKIDTVSIIEISLGPNVREKNYSVAESQWAVDLLDQLHKLDPEQHWSALIDLGKIPKHFHPPLATRVNYTEMMKDPLTDKVAFINHTSVHRMIIKAFMITQNISSKIRFFKSKEKALEWLKKINK